MSVQQLAIGVVASAFGLALYTYVGYPLALAVFGRPRPRPRTAGGGREPRDGPLRAARPDVPRIFSTRPSSSRAILPRLMRWSVP